MSTLGQRHRPKIERMNISSQFRDIDKKGTMPKMKMWNIHNFRKTYITERT